MPAPNLGRQSALSPANSALAANHEDALARPFAPADSPASEQPSSAPEKSTGKAKPTPQVEGYEVKEQTNSFENLTPEERNLALGGFAVLVAVGFAFNARRRKARVSFAAVDAGERGEGMGRRR